MTAIHPEHAYPLIVRYRLQLEALDDLHLPAYAGSTWRGMLGYGLRRAVCVTHQPHCDGCLLAGTCLYSTLFESPAPAEVAPRRFTSIPHPFVLALDGLGPRQVFSGQVVSIGINLGKGTSMGLGRYRLTDAASLPAARETA